MLLEKKGEPAIARWPPLALHIDDERLLVVNAAAGTAKMASENAVENFILLARDYSSGEIIIYFVGWTMGFDYWIS
jgi:hypothetical protein